MASFPVHSALFTDNGALASVASASAVALAGSAVAALAAAAVAFPVADAGLVHAIVLAPLAVTLVLVGDAVLAPDTSVAACNSRLAAADGALARATAAALAAAASFAAALTAALAAVASFAAALTVADGSLVCSATALSIAAYAAALFGSGRALSLVAVATGTVSAAAPLSSCGVLNRVLFRTIDVGATVRSTAALNLNAMPLRMAAGCVALPASGALITHAAPSAIVAAVLCPPRLSGKEGRSSASDARPTSNDACELSVCPLHCVLGQEGRGRGHRYQKGLPTQCAFAP
ncbi:MAG: hypothetical protein CMJ52_09220 [Planctomycetaceae bacterium]|nr:hypothetical protein [Planctomycetaceae bacterium]